MLEPPPAQPAAHGVSGVFVPFIFCLASLTVITVSLFFIVIFTISCSRSRSLSLILIFLHRNEEGKWQHAVERGGAAAMEAGKKIVAYSFPFFNHVTHCVLSLA